MDTIIWPGIFGNGVKAFFTKKTLGADLNAVSRAVFVKKENIYLPQQKHTDKILLLKKERTPEIADAVVTSEEGVLIGVQVADCVPGLLCDSRRSVVGVVHAGWRGTSMQIFKKTVLFFVEYFGSDPRDIQVAFGPSIRGSCYPVDADVRDAVLRATGRGDFAVAANGKYFLDLISANIQQIKAAGIPAGNVWQSPECTCCSPHDFHSYRRRGNYAGRQAGFIGIF